VYVFAKVGVYLPHSSYMQFRLGRFVPRSALQPGDAVFFNGASHVGIYIGSGRFVHAPHTGDVVKISSLGDSWYSSTYVGARRY
jgi:cell wall-associated NlpC family hydrolase